MTEVYPLSLALFDFVPNLFFLIGAYYLVQIAQIVRGSRCGRMALAGCLLIFMGGFLKATWKLLYTTNIADVQLLSEQQFVLLAPGFLALLVVAILIARMYRPAPGGASFLLIAGWKIPFLAVMTLTSMGAQGILAYFSFRRKARVAAAGFIVAFLCLVAMGAMASGEQTIARQWVEEIINSIGQMGFALGSLMLYRNIKATGC